MSTTLEAKWDVERQGLQRGIRDEGRSSTVPPMVHEVLESGRGRPLDDSIRAWMERRFGYDFSRVRIHADARAAESARAVNALAYTVGWDVVFGAGQYAPSSRARLRLLAHELAHVVQQTSRPVEDILELGGMSISQPKDCFERSADEAADAVMMGMQPAWHALSGLPVGLVLQRDVGRPGKKVVVLSPGAVLQASWGEPRRRPTPAEQVIGSLILSHIPPFARTMAYARRRPLYNVASSEGGGIGALVRMQQRVEYRVNKAMENFSFRVFQVVEVLMALLALGSTVIGVGLTQTPVVGRSLAGAGRTGVTVAEIGAGDLQASTRLAQQGARVIAVDPATPPASALAGFQRLGGTFIRSTAADIAASSADQVVQYFPWRIGGAGRFLHGGTWSAIRQAMRIVRPDGVITFVTEDLDTALFLSGQAARLGNTEVVQVVSTAAQAAPGATGAGVPNMSPGLMVFMVNIYPH